MSKSKQKKTFNIVAKLVGWGKDGSGKVEIMTATPDLKVDNVCKVIIAEDVMRKQPIDFAFRKKQGLRIGGIVILRKAKSTRYKEVVCKEVETLSYSAKDGPCVINRGAAVYIEAPTKDNSRLPEKVTIASIKDTKPVRNLNEAIKAGVEMIDTVSIFGQPGIIVTGIDSDDDIIEIVMDFNEGNPDESAIREKITTELDIDSLRMMKSAKRAWRMVPTFNTKVDTDPHRQGKISAQYANIDYGTKDEPMWTRTNAVLRGSFTEWLIADASLQQGGKESQASLLYQLV